jgi:hypothetical protein
MPCFNAKCDEQQVQDRIPNFLLNSCGEPSLSRKVVKDTKCVNDNDFDVWQVQV